ncbi:MAG: hypothetical protein R3230_00830 [Nitrosopumilaceae archaeon]|nr:hypothetical protein [Nitrosopumilaceae archaeon]
MPAIINNDLRIFNADAFQRAINDVPTYVFIGRETAWDDEQIPPTPTDSDLEKSELFEDLLAIKKINSSNIQSVIPRYDWTTGEIYEEYDHRVNMIDDKSDITGNFRRFYVVTDEFNVYKCISNNSRVASTVKPTGTPTTPFQTGDGYIWKYMYTIRANDVFFFLTSDWMPCYTLEVNDGSAQWQVQQTAVDGSIEHIVVDSGGSGYDSNNPPDVVITGDGTGATATATVDSGTGEVSKIVITNSGSGYTEATITFQNTFGGTGASATAVLSPVGGHGHDAKSELGGIHKMIRLELAGDENGTFPATSYRQAGLISLPLSDDIGSQLFFPNNDGGIFEIGQILTGQTSGATGAVRYIDPDGRFVYVSDVVGSFLQTETVQNNQGFTATLNDVNASVPLPEISLVAAKSELTNRTGKFLYVANRVAITRTQDQTEDLRFIISF